MDRTMVSIDVGTTKICTLVAEVGENEDLHIVGVGIAPSRGLRKGVVVSVKEATKAIATSVEKAERVSGYRIDNAYVGVTGSHIECLNSHGVVAISRNNRTITQEDIDRAMESALAVAIHPDSDIIHSIPRSFTIDGLDGVKDPVGMRGLRLEVEAHIITGAMAALENLVNCVNGAGVEVNELVLEPLASAEAVLNGAERELGVVLADMGGGTTDVAVFSAGSICHTAVLPTGGNHLTYDVAIGLRMPFEMAEEVKIRYGHALADAVADGETLEVAGFGDSAPKAIPRSYLARILEPRCAEIFELVQEAVRNSGYDDLLPAGVVLCGGTAQLQGLGEMGRRMLDLPVRVGAPNGMVGLVDVISNPAYATSVGLLLWGLRHDRGFGRTVRKKRGQGDLIQRFVNWLRVFLPRT